MNFKKQMYYETKYLTVCYLNYNLMTNHYFYKQFQPWKVFAHLFFVNTNRTQNHQHHQRKGKETKREITRKKRMYFNQRMLKQENEMKILL